MEIGEKKMSKVNIGNSIYGYVRVSSTDQNEDRQLIALNGVNFDSAR